MIHLVTGQTAFQCRHPIPWQDDDDDQSDEDDSIGSTGPSPAEQRRQMAVNGDIRGLTEVFTRTDWTMIDVQEILGLLRPRGRGGGPQLPDRIY